MTALRSLEDTGIEVSAMQEIEKVLGHEEVIKHLQNAAARDAVSHSYIFAGEKGSGKKLLAKVFAMTLQCEHKDKESQKQ